ncbi:MAG: prephenate dehydrogenase/arogenate dehydrogenase family protein [Desulfovermiculus sp.]|nr:prephenate dehydrogenase/arogenate dehydrogenase family protein [Desulfovermiculus sp.]
MHKVILIGAQGGMGRLLSRQMYSRGITVFCFDRPLVPEEAAFDLARSDLVLLAVPIEAMPDVLRGICPFVPHSTVLADICSVKERPLELMLSSHNGPVVGTHPLFGPQLESLTELKVAVVPGRDYQACIRMHAFLHHLGFAPFDTTAKTHDQAMAKIQSLNFVTTISYLASVAQDQEIMDFITPSFQRRLQAAQKMLTQDGTLFQTLFEANPYSQDAVRHFRRYLNLAAAGELDLLQEMAAWWWSDTQSGGEP